jgi:hypothetical protein
MSDNTPIYIGPAVNGQVYIIGNDDASGSINLADYVTSGDAALYNAFGASGILISGTGDNDSINLADGSLVVAEEWSGNNVFTFGSGFDVAIGGSGNDTFVLNADDIPKTTLNLAHTYIDNFNNAGNWYTTNSHDFLHLLGFSAGSTLKFDFSLPNVSIPGTGFNFSQVQYYQVDDSNGHRESADFAVIMANGDTHHLSAGDYAFS